jgi:hypothetical protein
MSKLHWRQLKRERLKLIQKGKGKLKLLKRRINIEDDNVSAARGALQQALSLDFKIRENPVFMMIKAQIESKDGQWG